MSVAIGAETLWAPVAVAMKVTAPLAFPATPDPASVATQCTVLLEPTASGAEGQSVNATWGAPASTLTASVPGEDAFPTLSWTVRATSPDSVTRNDASKEEDATPVPALPSCSRGSPLSATSTSAESAYQSA